MKAKTITMITRTWLLLAALSCTVPSLTCAQQSIGRLGLAPLSLSIAQLAPTPYWAGGIAHDAKPSSGMGQLIAGWALFGIGVVNLALIPVCYADFYPTNAKDLCVGLSIGLGVVGLAVGIPLLIVGYNKRAAYKAWRQRNDVAYHLSRIRLAAQSGGAVASYQGEW